MQQLALQAYGLYAFLAPELSVHFNTASQALYLDFHQAVLVQAFAFFVGRARYFRQQFLLRQIHLHALQLSLKRCLRLLLPLLPGRFRLSGVFGVFFHLLLGSFFGSRLVGRTYSPQVGSLLFVFIQQPLSRVVGRTLCPHIRIKNTGQKAANVPEHLQRVVVYPRENARIRVHYSLAALAGFLLRLRAAKEAHHKVEHKRHRIVQRTGTVYDVLKACFEVVERKVGQLDKERHHSAHHGQYGLQKRPNVVQRWQQRRHNQLHRGCQAAAQIGKQPLKRRLQGAQQTVQALALALHEATKSAAGGGQVGKHLLQVGKVNLSLLAQFSYFFGVHPQHLGQLGVYRYACFGQLVQLIALYFARCTGFSVYQRQFVEVLTGTGGYVAHLVEYRYQLLTRKPEGQQRTPGIVHLVGAERGAHLKRLQVCYHLLGFVGAAQEGFKADGELLQLSGPAYAFFQHLKGSAHRQQRRCKAANGTQGA